MKLAAKGTVTETPADQADWQTDDPISAESLTLGEGFIFKHPLDEREQSVHARYQESVAYLRREYQRRLSELNKWYDCQKVMTFDGLVQELEAINR